MGSRNVCERLFSAASARGRDGVNLLFPEFSFALRISRSCAGLEARCSFGLNLVSRPGGLRGERVAGAHRLGSLRRGQAE